MQEKYANRRHRCQLATFFTFFSAMISLRIVVARPVFRDGKSALYSRCSGLKDPDMAPFQKKGRIGRLLLTECRGGAVNSEDPESEGDGYDDEYDSYDDEEEGRVDGEENQRMQKKSSPRDSSLLLSIAQSVFATTKMAISIVASAFAPLSKADPKIEASVAGRCMSVLKSAFNAVLNPTGTESKATYQKVHESMVPKTSCASDSSSSDFGSYLSQAYGVTDGRGASEGSSPSPILGGSLSDALKIARSNARLIVILIPSSPPHKKGKEQNSDRKAIASFLSSETSRAAKKKARNNAETAAFVLWGAKAGSSEATTAMKLLKVKPTSAKGNKRPVLLVAYPAQVSTMMLLRVVFSIYCVDVI